MSVHPRPLTIHDLFYKAFSSPRIDQDSDHQQHDILSFVGQVVHTIDSSRITRLAANRDQELDGYPLHPNALSVFKTHGDGSLPYQVVWLGPLQIATSNIVAHTIQRLAPGKEFTARPTLPDNKNLKGPSNRDRVVVIIDSDDEKGEQEPPTTMNEYAPQPNISEREVDDGTSSCISWSDSNISRSDAEDEPDIGKSGMDTLPTTMVAVLLDSASCRDGSSSALPFKHGEIVEITNTLMLQQELTLSRVVSCVGIARTTCYRISPSDQNMRTKFSDEQIPGRKRLMLAKESMPTNVPNCEKRTTTSMARKRSRSNTVVLNDDSDDEVARTLESPKEKKRIREDEQDVGSLSIRLLKPWSHQAFHSQLDPLKFLARPQSDNHILDSRISRPVAGDTVDYISNLWCSLPIAPLSTTTIPTTPPTSNGTANLTTRSDTITRHICRVNTIQRVQIRAICDECENDYKSQICTFGCSSRKWRTQVQMECTIGDGTSVAELRLGSDQEAVMWTLLGLKESSRDRQGCEIRTGSTTTSAEGREGTDAVEVVETRTADPYEDLRNKVLRIVARRGDLTYKAGPATDLPASSTSKSLPPNKSKENEKAKGKGKVKEKASDVIAQQKGHVESVDQDQSQRATTEEKLWLDICTVRLRKQQSFVLSATTSTLAANGSTPSLPLSGEAVKRRVVLKKSWVQIQKWRTVETLVRPPLVLWALAAECIRPYSETKMLLGRLLQQQQ
ncbi:hypothetical protein BGZ97_009709 [Linnemannia gamsii]|jgi:hypothetical protein|uniref:Uncharacterized protein n=1 Tax=Linnemannia gamsii TaxID=64522 RepID=A0A9P6R706_9FUNG|nr:hypothetical protein BGZ97_009709 [Linnemannia gamsii]